MRKNIPNLRKGLSKKPYKLLRKEQKDINILIKISMFLF